MDIRYHDDLSDEKLISLVDDDATTIHEMEIEEMLKTEVARDSMLEHCDGGRIASQGRELYELDAAHHTHTYCIGTQTD